MQRRGQKRGSKRWIREKKVGTVKDIYDHSSQQLPV
jgi:hypothetical protein